MQKLWVPTVYIIYIFEQERKFIIYISCYPQINTILLCTYKYYLLKLYAILCFQIVVPVDGLLECPLCLAKFDENYFAKLSTCNHRSCFDCFQQYLRIEICESRVNITCPECTEAMHPNGIFLFLQFLVL